ncbi:MAG: multicomponent Na+:H+ antiporter subunit G [Oceanospirillaceae bacterium]|jgi:multicomponent Na+:H+ antiporter subunit G
MDFVVSLISGLCLLLGGFICFSGAIGVIRFPDFYTRMHAASVTDTAGFVLILFGLMLISPDYLVFAKLVMILLLGLLVGPTTSHVLAKSAYRNGVRPQLIANDDSDGEGGNASKS